MKKNIEIKELTHRIKNFKVGNEQSYVEVYPKTKKHDRSDIDIFRLVMNSIDENDGATQLKEVDMTPDEAIELSSTLSLALSFWLINYKPYWDTFMKKRRTLDKKYKRNKNN